MTFLLKKNAICSILEAKYCIKVDNLMELFIAKQPIFDRNKNVFSYELLYRLGDKNIYEASDGDFASANVILNCFNVIGIKKLTNSKKTFINFTKTLLTEEIATIFPKDSLVIEVLEDIHGDTDILAYCKNLKDLGYEIALDDFVFNEDFISLCKLANYIKIDFRITPIEEQKQVLEKIKFSNIKLIAEKVETQEEFTAAKKMGYDYFQGYFFSKPVIFPFNDIAPIKINYLRLLEKANNPEVNVDELNEIISHDISLSFNLLKFINSAAFFLKTKINTVKQALVFLGENETKKWLTLIILKGLNNEPNSELINYTLERSRFMSTIAQKYNTIKKTHINADEAFLTGMLSTLDVLLNRPLEELMEEIPASDVIINAILHKSGNIGTLLKLAESYQSADWKNLLDIMKAENIEAMDVLELYSDAVLWSYELFKEI
jgi:c-di-GMP-related signal transduction protein